MRVVRVHPDPARINCRNSDPSELVTLLTRRPLHSQATLLRQLSLPSFFKMPLWVNAERNRITNFFNKLTKPTSSRPTSSRSAPPKVSSPKHSTSKPASPGPPSTEPIRCSHEEHSLQDTATEGGVFALRRSYHSLATQSRARAIDARVKNLVKLIEKIRDGQYEGEQLLIKRKLTYSEYGRMLQFIENSEDEALRAYFNDKLR